MRCCYELLVYILLLISSHTIYLLLLLLMSTYAYEASVCVCVCGNFQLIHDFVGTTYLHRRRQPRRQPLLLLELLSPFELFVHKLSAAASLCLAFNMSGHLISNKSIPHAGTHTHNCRKCHQPDDDRQMLSIDWAIGQIWFLFLHLVFYAKIIIWFLWAISFVHSTWFIQNQRSAFAFPMNSPLFLCDCFRSRYTFLCKHLFNAIIIRIVVYWPTARILHFTLKIQHSSCKINLLHFITI